MRIVNNTAAFNTWSAYTQNTLGMQTSMSHLATGVKNVADDPAGVGISERMRAQASGTAMARNNVDNGISMIQTADSWLQKINDMLNRMGELAIESNDGTKTSTDRNNVQTEFKQMQAEIVRITSGTMAAAKFNGKILFGATEATTTPPTTAQRQAAARTVFQTHRADAITSISPFFPSPSDNIDAAIESLVTSVTNGTPQGQVGSGQAVDAACKALDPTNPFAEFNVADQEAVNLLLWGRSTSISPSILASSTKSTFYAAAETAYANASGTTSGGGFTIQAGADEAQTIDITLKDLRSNGSSTFSADGLEIKWSDVVNASGMSIGGNVNASQMTVNIRNLSGAVDFIANTRASLGSQQKRFMQTRDALLSYEDNVRAAESKVRDVDMARESTTFAKYQILSQSSNAMLAQANQLPQSILQLLG